MKPSTLGQLMLFALSALAAGSCAAVPGERPRLEDYASANEFLAAMEVWIQDHSDSAAVVVAHVPPAAPATAVAALTLATSMSVTPATIAAATATAGVAAAPVLDPTSELAPPPLEVKGPEDVDNAVDEARAFVHPNYKEKIRYHRTTHVSFPLTKIDGEDMSEASVDNTLGIQGTTDEEKKKSLQALSDRINQDQHKLQDDIADPISNNNAAGVSMVSGLTDSMLNRTPNGRVDINVSGH